MPQSNLEAVLRSLLVDPGLAIEEGGRPIRELFNLDLNRTFAWPVRCLDKNGVAERVYRAFFYKSMGCGYAVFYGLVSAMADSLGAPHDSFPLEVLEHKKGRFSGAGKVCGALVGAEAVLALFWGEADRAPLLRELQSWYANTMLPLYAPPKNLTDMQDKDGKPLSLPELVVPGSIAQSTICTDSLVAWSAKCDFKIMDAERKERCSRLAVDTALKTLEIINAQAGA